MYQREIKKRIIWLDIAKTIAIICTIVVHTVSNNGILSVRLSLIIDIILLIVCMFIKNKFIKIIWCKRANSNSQI